MRLRLADQLLVAHRQQAVRLRVPVDGVTRAGQADAPDAEGAIAGGDAHAGDAFRGRERVQSEMGGSVKGTKRQSWGR